MSLIKPTFKRLSSKLLISIGGLGAVTAEMVGAIDTGLENESVEEKPGIPVVKKVRFNGTIKPKQVLSF